MSHGTAASRGILLGFSKNLECVVQDSEIDQEGRFIVAHVSIGGKAITVVGAYLEPSLNVVNYNTILANIMAAIVKGGNSRVIIGGDFNAILQPHLDSKRGVDSHNKGPHLNRFMDTHDLSDIWRVGHSEEKRFTCFHTATQSRLDLLLASPAFLTHVLDCEIGISYKSDHSPVYVEFSLSKETRGKGYWRIPDFLLSDPVYMKKIDNVLEEALVGFPNLNPMKVWDFTKIKVRGDSIKHMADCHKIQQSWTQRVDDDLNTVTLARDRTSNTPQQIKYYTEKIQLLLNFCGAIHNAKFNLTLPGSIMS